MSNPQYDFRARPLKVYDDAATQVPFRLEFDYRGLIPMEELHVYPLFVHSASRLGCSPTDPESTVELHGYYKGTSDRAALVLEASENAQHLLGRIEARDLTLQNGRLDGPGWISGVLVRDVS